MQGANLTAMVLNGTLPQWRLDDQCIRIMSAFYFVDRESNTPEIAPNMFSWSQDTFSYEHAYARQNFDQVNWHFNVRQDHAKLARKIASAGTVLLKNVDGALPLTGDEKLTTIFGSDAGENLWGPNGCPDRGCANGTFAMGWGSGSVEFPYLITPLEAIKAKVREQDGAVESVLDDYAYTQASALARRVGNVGGVCMVFGSAPAGEGYIIVDGNEGDRNNLTLWHNADQLIRNVSSQCNNTVVVMHTAGPVLTDWDNENITAIIWAAIPGQESGNALVDILYGAESPAGRSPFTWGAAREDYGNDVLYEPNNDPDAPQQDFVEGIFTDYRYFDQQNITPTYEFGFGLSYTTFNYSNLQIQPGTPGPYAPTTGQTAPAPTFGEIDQDLDAYLFPDEISPVTAYIYPYLNSTNLADATADPFYGVDVPYPEGAFDAGPQERKSSSGYGGNPRLYDVMFVVSADITNTGSVISDEVAQLYISLGGPESAPVVLRGFDRLPAVRPGETRRFEAHVLRRDLSNWNTEIQDW